MCFSKHLKTFGLWIVFPIRSLATYKVVPIQELKSMAAELITLQEAPPRGVCSTFDHLGRPVGDVVTGEGVFVLASH